MASGRATWPVTPVITILRPDSTSLFMVPFVLATLTCVHLYAAFLGGELAEDRMGEDHEVVFVVAQDTTSARKAAQKKWGGTGRAHVDAVTRLEMIDGYTVALERTGAGDVTEMEGYN
jgi:hypothetical protein